jgi:hypothetical protein
MLAYYLTYSRLQIESGVSEDAVSGHIQVYITVVKYSSKVY